MSDMGDMFELGFGIVKIIIIFVVVAAFIGGLMIGGCTP